MPENIFGFKEFNFLKKIIRIKINTNILIIRIKISTKVKYKEKIISKDLKSLIAFMEFFKAKKLFDFQKRTKENKDKKQNNQNSPGLIIRFKSP